MQTKTVITPCGSIVGCVTDYGASFRGVKYATAKRFEKSVLITKYDTEQIALEQGVCCPQMRAYWNEEHRFYYQEFRKGKSFKYSEDCLILDIHVPSDAHDCPVIVFIHGGSFTGGSINEMQFDGSAYTKRGVIFVAINYRLNVFGFFADNEHCGGNLGLYDQYTAIEWVRQNIAGFGGNPDNITLMGQSAVAVNGALLGMNYNTAKGAKQTLENLNTMYDLATIIPAVLFGLMAIVLLVWYPLSKKKVAELQVAKEAHLKCQYESNSIAIDNVEGIESLGESVEQVEEEASESENATSDEVEDDKSEN